MQTSLQKCTKTILFFFVFFLFSGILISQNKSFIGTETLRDGEKTKFRTTPQVNNLTPESLDEHLTGKPGLPGTPYVLGGSTLWFAEDAQSMSTTVRLNSDGSAPFVAWTLNNMRASLYGTTDNVPLWEFPTIPFDATVAVSGDGSVLAVTKGQDFYLLDKTGGNIKYQLTLPDTFYASSVAVSRNSQILILLAQAYAGSNTARAYALDLTGATPVISWMFDVPNTDITNWTAVSISASGTKAILTGRYHYYIVNTNDGSLVWDHFVDNTESPSGINSDGSVIVTADNSGFVQTRLYNSTSHEYDLLWQYRVPVGAFTNWASACAISADGRTILAGSLIFLGSGFDGSIMAFDTYGNGTPKWVLGGVGDLVDDIAISDDGRVAAVVTWGDLAHTKPDLYVFDVATGIVTYNVTTTGSFFSVDLTPDGSRVIAGGKGAHAREFGMGGKTYYCQVDLGGGSVSGSVDLGGTTNESGVLIKAQGTPRTALTDASGNYLLANIPAGTYTITAEKPGYNFGSVSGVTVTEGGTATGINFTMPQFPGTAPTLTALSGLVGKIRLQWSGLKNDADEIARITGDNYSVRAGDLAPNSAVSAGKQNLQSNDYPVLADSIAVYRSLAQGGPYTKIAVLPSTSVSYDDISVFPLRTYYYVVNKFNTTGQTPYSNEASAEVSDTLLTFDVVAPESPNVPTFDGVLSPGEWSDAVKIDISDVFGYSGGTPKPQGSVFMYMKFSQQTKMLYVAGEDFLNPTKDENEGFGFYLDDNNNNVFEPINSLPIYLEGNFWAYWHSTGPLVRFRPLYTNGAVGTVDTLFDAPVAFSDATGHLVGEFGIPMSFMKGRDLQVYGPDKKVGLGAFLIARQSGAALFNGWWPQTMNSVFNPMYFGDVQINVELTAPPKFPSNITIMQEGVNLHVYWNDPTEGLNNDPLAAPPVIRVFKNNEYVASVAAGVQNYFDHDVLPERWYEYQLDAYIVVGNDTLYSPVSSSYGQFAYQSPTLVPITYDDGQWEAFYVVDFTYNDNKFAVKYTPPYYPCRVLRMEATVNARDGFDYTINSDSSGYPGKVIAGPFRSASKDPTQVGIARFTIPGDLPPLVEAGDFWVVINYLPSLPGSPGIGVDGTPPNQGRGMFYTTPSGWQPFPAGNLMVTTYIADPAPVGIKENTGSIPSTYMLGQNYPNPFNPSTVINFQLPEAQFVTVEVFNALGQKVKSLVNESKEAGTYSITWDGTNISGSPVSSGIYFYSIKAGKFNDVKKMMLLR